MVLGSPTELRRHVRQVIVGQVQSTEPSRLQDALWEDRELVALLGTRNPPVISYSLLFFK